MWEEKTNIAEKSKGKQKEERERQRKRQEVKGRERKSRGKTWEKELLWEVWSGGWIKGCESWDNMTYLTWWKDNESKNQVTIKLTMIPMGCTNHLNNNITTLYK